MLGFEPTTYGSESECATHYTIAPHMLMLVTVSLSCFIVSYFRLRDHLCKFFIYNTSDVGQLVMYHWKRNSNYAEESALSSIIQEHCLHAIVSLTTIMILNVLSRGTHLHGGACMRVFCVVHYLSSRWQQGLIVYIIQLPSVGTGGGNRTSKVKYIIPKGTHWPLTTYIVQ